MIEFICRHFGVLFACLVSNLLIFRTELYHCTVKPVLVATCMKQASGQIYMYIEMYLS